MGEISSLASGSAGKFKLQLFLIAREHLFRRCEGTQRLPQEEICSLEREDRSREERKLRGAFWGRATSVAKGGRESVWSGEMSEFIDLLVFPADLENEFNAEEKVS